MDSFTCLVTNLLEYLSDSKYAMNSEWKLFYLYSYSFFVGHPTIKNSLICFLMIGFKIFSVHYKSQYI